MTSGGPGQGNFFSLMSNRPRLVRMPASISGGSVRPPSEPWLPGRGGGEAEQLLRLRQSPEVQEVGNVFWATAVGVRWTGGDDGAELELERTAYIQIMQKLYRALFEIYDWSDAQMMAEREWIRDTGDPNSETIGKVQFLEALYDIARAWTIGVWSPELLASFLWDLFQHVTSGKPPNVCKWKADSEISFAGWRLGEHTLSWSRVPVPDVPPADIRPKLREPSFRASASNLPKGTGSDSHLGAVAWRRIARAGR